MASWFSEIAGKAEDILNKMDQKAAVVLNMPEDVKPKIRNVGGYEYRENDNLYGTTGSIGTVYPPRQHLNTTVQGSAPGSGLHSRNSSISSSFSTISTRELTNNSSGKPDYNGRPDDEKLFEFLNSKGSSTNSIHGSDSPKTDVTSEDKLWSEIDSPDDAEIVPEKLETIAEVQKDSPKIDKLKEQIKSMTKEITQLTKRNIDLETDYKRLQKRLDNWQNQISSSDNALRELQARESDLKAAIDAKDSQLAVLRVRLQECDDQLRDKQAIIKRLEKENDTLLKEREENFSNFDENILTLRRRIKDLEETLLNEKELRLGTQQETMNAIERYQESQKQLSEEIANLQRQCALEKSVSKDLEKQLSTLHSSHEALESEFSEYKLRAQRTLQAKDDLIKALQNDGSSSINAEDQGKINKLLQSESDSLLMEVQDLRNRNETLKKELEAIKQNQIYALNERISELTMALEEERHSKNGVEEELRRVQDELRYFQDDFDRTKNNLTARIQDRDAEIEKLRKQLVSKRSSAPGASSYEELETRIKNLTENLIQKQTYVEQLSSERHSLTLQLERTEARLREALDVIVNKNNMTNLPGAVTIGMVHSSSASNLVNRAKPLVEENPYDSQVTRRVKRAYGHIDDFSLRLGLILRHYPSARAFVILYILLLHTWVIFILFNYRPKINEL